jgi:hypothetical protein
LIGFFAVKPNSIVIVPLPQIEPIHAKGSQILADNSKRFRVVTIYHQRLYTKDLGLSAQNFSTTQKWPKAYKISAIELLVEMEQKATASRRHAITLLSTTCLTFVA